jgi:putative aldouronate transport system substrate-binding protein
VANVKATWDKYRYELLTGASDPEKMVPKIVEELKKAGMDTIMKAAQEQIDAFFQ